MKTFRTLLAAALILHGLAHASAGMWATDIGGRTLVTILWEMAAVGFIASGAGLFGVAPLARWWRALAVVAALSSLMLLLIYSHPLFVAGLVTDFLLAAAALAPASGGQLAALPPVRRGAGILLGAFTVYVAVVIGLRPWHTSWGSTRSEQQMVLIGDPPLGESHYRIDHATTIRAPVDSVWPWLVQSGQDPAGFSLGGLFGRAPGRKVKQIEPGRAFVLENGRAFVLEPTDHGWTRLHIRTRGDGIPTLSGIAITPVALLLLEPAHFIMERRMMLGLKQRAERRTAE